MVVITVNICKIGVHSHKSYIVYIKLCKVCLITFSYRENAHMSHLFIMFSSGFNFIPVCGKAYLGNFPISTYNGQILVTHWQICRLQSKFRFLPQLSIKSIFKSYMVHIGYCLGPIAWLMLGACTSHSEAHAHPCPSYIWCSHSTSTSLHHCTA